LSVGWRRVDYLRETARVGGRSKVVRTTYLGRAEDIERRLVAVAEPKAVVVGSFGAVAAAWMICQELQIAQAIDRALGERRGSQGDRGRAVARRDLRAARGHLLRLRFQTDVEDSAQSRRALGRSRVERLMRSEGIQGAKRRGKPWRTTKADPLAQRRPDLVQRDFSASRPDELWFADSVQEGEVVSGDW
jgi:hypothetical protein